MLYQVELGGKTLQVTLTPAATRALSRRTQPLEAQMELYFSCLVRLKVRFLEPPGGDSVPATDQLAISFRPVMTARCGKDYPGEEPPLTDFPLARPEAFTPRWLHIDFRRGEWSGEFGFSAHRAF